MPEAAGRRTLDEVTSLLDKGPPFTVHNEPGGSPFLLICEHASRHIPAHLNGLGLSAAMQRSHIAWDIGAAGLAMKLADRLDAALVSQTYSRLLYDCNRPPEAASAMPEQSELTAIPGNCGLTPAARQQRIDEIYAPFHRRIEELVAARHGANRATIIVTIHSFTGMFKGQRRALDLGILHDNDALLADHILAEVARQTGYVTKRNEPYGADDGVMHTLQRQALRRGLHNVMLELRNDLIAEDGGQMIWAERLANLLDASRKEIDLPHAG